MGYYLQAIIGKKSILQQHITDFQAAVVTPLNFDFGLIPITDELLDEIGAGGSAPDKFYKFTEDVSKWLSAISVSTPVAYVEAEYFGGIGSQCAIVLSNHKQLLPPTNESRAINKALRLLGVVRGSALDEFEALGLGERRRMEDWVAAAEQRS